MERKSPLYITGERNLGPMNETMELSPVRRRVPTGRLSQDLHNCVAGLQDPDAVKEYFPEREGWVIGRVEPDSVPGLGGGGIRARREYTGTRAVEVIFGKDAHAMVVMPYAGPIGTPISSTKSMVIAPLGGGESGESGIGITKARPVRGGMGYLMLTAEYGDSREFLGAAVRFRHYLDLDPQVKTVTRVGEEIKEEKTGLIRPGGLTRATMSMAAECGGPSEVCLKAESDGEDGTDRKLILELNGRSTLVIGGLTGSIEIGRLFDMVRNEVEVALAKAETG